MGEQCHRKHTGTCSRRSLGGTSCDNRPLSTVATNRLICQTVAASRQNAGRALLSYATPCVLREQPRSSWLGTLYEAVAAVAVLENAAKASARRRRAASARREAPWSAHNPGQRPLPLLDSPQPRRFHALAQALQSDLFRGGDMSAISSSSFYRGNGQIQMTTQLLSPAGSYVASSGICPSSSKRWLCQQGQVYPHRRSATLDRCHPRRYPPSGRNRCCRRRHAGAAGRCRRSPSRAQGRRRFGSVLPNLIHLST